MSLPPPGHSALEVTRVLGKQLKTRGHSREWLKERFLKILKRCQKGVIQWEIDENVLWII